MSRFFIFLAKLFGWEEKVEEIYIEKEIIREIPVIKEKVVIEVKEVVVDNKEVIIQEKIVEVPVIQEKIVCVDKIVEIIKEVPQSLTELQKHKQYWDNRWAKSNIVYYGRILKNEKNIQTAYWNGWQVPVDVRQFILKDDNVLKYIIDKYNLKKPTHDETILAIQDFVCNKSIDQFYATATYSMTQMEGLLEKYIKEDRCRPSRVLTYTYDDEKYNTPEYWLFPFETLASGWGDCEDGALLIASLAINAGIPNYKVKVAVGNVSNRFYLSPTAPSFKDVSMGSLKIPGISEGGHAYCIYLASDDEWRIIDWCYYEDSSVPVLTKPLAKDGGKYKCYFDTWFTFNDEFSWNQKALALTGRLDEVCTLEEILMD